MILFNLKVKTSLYKIFKEILNKNKKLHFNYNYKKFILIFLIFIFCI